jgi:hypothetical protein
MSDMDDVERDPLEEALGSAYRDFVRVHGYHPGIRFENGVLYLLPLENEGVVPAEPDDSRA